MNDVTHASYEIHLPNATSYQRPNFQHGTMDSPALLTAPYIQVSAGSTSAYSAGIAVGSLLLRPWNGGGGRAALVDFPIPGGSRTE